jgi:bacterioferritin
MKGQPQILDVLNDVLTGELTAINQYFLHAKMLKNWGFARLAAHVHHESIDEMKHADAIVERILFLEGLPNLQKLFKLNIGQTVKEQFAADLALEHEAIKRLAGGIRLARDLDDSGSMELLIKIQIAEEEHIDWLETQLGLIDQLGESAYLSQQLHS